jgi:hypothetical protein
MILARSTVMKKLNPVLNSNRQFFDKRLPMKKGHSTQISGVNLMMINKKGGQKS